MHDADLRAENANRENLLAILAENLSERPTLNPRNAEKPAAVLVPIIARPMPTVLLTLRTEGMSLHAGQICFPGGRFQTDDRDLLRTALRETEEETGISPDCVVIGGFLDPFLTGTGYTVLPAIGVLDRDPILSRDEREVADIFEVPLDHLLDPKNREFHRVERNGVIRTFHAIRYGERFIWGATAGMIVNLSEKLARR
jgi:8-oxo-dGTP pyrophosphatase MutT (NUDIX family)